MGYYHIRNSRFERTPMNCPSSPYCRTNVRNFRGLFTAKVVKSHVKLRVKSDTQKVNWVHREPMLLKLTQNSKHQCSYLICVVLVNVVPVCMSKEVSLDCAAIFSVPENFLACYHAKAEYRMFESQCEDHNILRNTGEWLQKCSHFVFNCFSN